MQEANPSLVLEPIQYGDLPFIADIPPLSGEDRACLEAVSEVLREHGAEARFGVCLLHRHFDLQEDEALVERCDLAARTLTTSPHKQVNIDPTQLVQTMWRFDVQGREVSCVVFCEKEDDGHHRHHEREQM